MTDLVVIPLMFNVIISPSFKLKSAAILSISGYLKFLSRPFSTLYDLLNSSNAAIKSNESFLSGNIIPTAAF
jgi:hypothetical protein